MQRKSLDSENIVRNLNLLFYMLTSLEFFSYCSNVEDAYSIYENNPDMRCYNTVSVEDLFQTYSSGEELSHRYNKTISIKTKIINIRTGEIINRFELEKNGFI